MVLENTGKGKQLIRCAKSLLYGDRLDKLNFSSLKMRTQEIWQGKQNNELHEESECGAVFQYFFAYKN